MLNLYKRCCEGLKLNEKILLMEIGDKIKWSVNYILRWYGKFVLKLN